MKIQNKIRILSQKGFSMVEMVVYVALLAFFMIIAVNGAIIMMSSYAKAGSARLLDSSIELLISKLSREARNSTGINDALSTFNQSPGRISFFVKEGGTSIPVEFYTSSGVMKIRKGGAELGDVTLPGVSVDSVVFKKIDNVGKQAFRMTIRLIANNGGQTKAETFYYTAVLRGTY